MMTHIYDLEGIQKPNNEMLSHVAPAARTIKCSYINATKKSGVSVLQTSLPIDGISCFIEVNVLKEIPKEMASLIFL